MSEQAEFQEAPSAPPATSEPERKLSPREAGRILASLRKPKEESPPVVAAETPAPSEPESPAAPAAEDAAPPSEEAPGETQATEPEEIPPIEPPRSWTRDAKERWQSLPRETQEYLAERETERERELRRGQNETAEKLKGLTAKEQAVEQARQQYEQALPQLFQTLQSAQAGEFSDVKTIADVERLAREDWPRYLQWDVSQKKLAAVQQEMANAQQRQSQEKFEKFNKFATEQDKLFLEKVPEMADAAKAEKLQKTAMTVLEKIGFTPAELADSWNGQKDLSLRDHRVQLLIRDAIKWREVEKKEGTLSSQKKPVPPVQRPGAARSPGEGNSANVQNLRTELQNASGIQAARIAVQLMQAKRRA